ncbi:MAG TPA: FkbM family methyltransferase [Syntrophobacteria bacterium]|nr:FkbM family methyltransferase [Syntrophobacteria bacterium]
MFQVIAAILGKRLIHSDGRTWPWPRLRPVRKLFRTIFHLRDKFTKDVEIVDGSARYRFRCETFDEFSRCMKMFIKEPGTCAWISGNVKPGQVFYDIGANIGIYSIHAAERVGNKGKVFAFEPHSANFTRLLDNIAANHLEDVIIPCALALHDKDGFLSFRYSSFQAGSSDSQLSSSSDGPASEEQNKICELKYAVSIDTLVASGKFSPPHHIKIDVDGNELFILRGMAKLLTGAERPDTIQVEINKSFRAEIVNFMESHGYILTQTHRTRYGSELVEQGVGAEEHAYNIIFRQRI